MRAPSPHRALLLLLVLLTGGLGMPVLHGAAHVPAEAHTEAVVEVPHAHAVACALCDATFAAPPAAAVGAYALVALETGPMPASVSRTDAEVAASGSRGPPLVG